jgi:hypothetical protein
MKRRGFWWDTMGFTRTHVVGVFATEGFLCLVGCVLARRAIDAEPGLALRLLLGALCAFALGIVVLLASILSLLFYAAWPKVADSPEKPKDWSDSSNWPTLQGPRPAD